MKVSRASFDGSLLARGFWLYVWRITQAKRVVLYVGRTGDSSSRYASSPFSRLGQHLDIRPNAKANTLLKNLRKAEFEPQCAGFELFSIGPLFPEQQTLESHRKYRDIVAPLEAALADWLRNAGHEVMGTHPVARPHDEALFTQLITAFKAIFP